MTTYELQEQLHLTVFRRGEDRPVTAGYSCDLLSFVLSHAPAGCAWITVLNHGTVAAIAQQRRIPCILLAEGVLPSAELQQFAEQEGISLLGSAADAFSLAAQLQKLL